jgi:hypothetical protein
MHPGYGYGLYGNPCYWQPLPPPAAPVGPLCNVHRHFICNIRQMSSLLVSRVLSAIEYIFATRLDTHVLFTYLSNAGVVQFANLSNMAKLSNAGKAALTFPEWTQAKFRFMRLIATHMERDLAHWALHYQSLSKCNLWTEGYWGQSLAYNICICKACSGTTHNLGRWNEVLFTKLESQFNLDTASAVLWEALQQASSSGPVKAQP